MDHQKFGKRVQEFLRRKGLHQNKLADRLDVTPSFLSRMLTGARPLTPDRAKACILYLAEAEAIIESGYVDELLELAGCEDFSPTDWKSWPLKNLTPSEAGALQRPAPQQQTFPSDVFDSEVTRRKYLKCVVRWYQSLTLPAGSQKAFALQSVFQPLQLRREVFFAEDLCKSRLSSRQNLGLKSGMDNWPQARSEGGGPSDLEGANATGSFPRMR